MFAFSGLVAGPAAGCRCKVPLQGACVRMLFALWSLVAGAAAGCYCQGAAVRVVCALELGW